MKLNWKDISIPWIEDEDLISLLIDKVDLVDVMDKYGIDYTKSGGSDITQRARCPLPEHGGGGERTPSFFVYNNKSFKCYGCSHGGNIITFVSLLEGCPNLEAANKLLKSFNIINSDGVDIVRKPQRPAEQKVATHVLNASVVIREFVGTKKQGSEYKKWCDWADTQFVKLDKCLDLEDDEWERVKKFCDKIVEKLKAAK